MSSTPQEKIPLPEIETIPQMYTTCKEIIIIIRIKVNNNLSPKFLKNQFWDSIK